MHLKNSTQYCLEHALNWSITQQPEERAQWWYFGNWEKKIILIQKRIGPSRF